MYDSVTKTITAPVSIKDVCDALGYQYNPSTADLGSLCISPRINVWARYKPTEGGTIEKRTLEYANVSNNPRYVQCTNDSIFRLYRTYYTKSGNNYIEATGLNGATFNANKTMYYFKSYNENNAIIRGVAYRDGSINTNFQNVYIKENVIPRLTYRTYGSNSNYGWWCDNGAGVWNLRQFPQYYRLADFNGYCHDASFNYTDHFFEPTSHVDNATNRTSDHFMGVCYDVMQLVLRFDTTNATAFSMDENNLPVQCLEDYDGGDQYPSLRFEEIVGSLENAHAGDVGNFLNMNLGLVFMFPNRDNTEWFMFNTGVNFGRIFGAHAGNTELEVFNIVNNGITYKVGQISIENSRINFSVDFLKLSESYITNGYFITDATRGDIPIRTKIVAIEGANNTPSFHRNPSVEGDVSAFKLYSFEVKNGFCVKNTTMTSERPFPVNWNTGLHVERYMSENETNSGTRTQQSDGRWRFAFGTRSFYLTRDNVDGRYIVNGTNVYFGVYADYIAFFGPGRTNTINGIEYTSNPGPILVREGSLNVDIGGTTINYNCTPYPLISNTNVPGSVIITVKTSSTQGGPYGEPLLSFTISAG